MVSVRRICEQDSAGISIPKMETAMLVDAGDIDKFHDSELGRGYVSN